ncbi:MAG: acyltransferase family protein [Terriglobales bacterium]
MGARCRQVNFGRSLTIAGAPGALARWGGSGRASREVRPRRIPELDGLRALAVLAVISFHYSVATVLANPATGMGWAGVDLFFVLSGYLITTILLNSRGRPRYFSTFYARRTLRIFPVYFLLLAIYIAAARLAGGPQPWSYWLMHGLYLSSIAEHFHYWAFAAPAFVYAGVAVLWSLSIEELFYLGWAPIVRWLRPARLPLALAAAIVGAPLLRWWVHTAGFTEYRFLPARCDSLAWGALLAWMLHRHGAAIAARWLKPLGWSAAAGLVALIASTGGSRSSPVFAVFGYTALAALFCAVVGWLVLTSGSAALPARLLRLPPARYLGQISYMLYLVHYPVLTAVAGWTSLNWGAGGFAVVLRDAIAMIAALGIAAVSWHWLEAPILHFKDRRLPSPAVAEPAVARMRTETVAAIRESL